MLPADLVPPPGSPAPAWRCLADRRANAWPAPAQCTGDPHSHRGDRQAFEAASASSAAERIFLAVAGVGALVAIIACVASASKAVVGVQSGQILIA